MQTSFTLLLLSFCTGVALQLILTQLPALAWVIVGDVVLLGLVAWRFYGLRLRSSPPTNSRLTSCLSLLISALLGWNSTMHHAVQRAAHSLAPHANGQTFWVQGHVVSMVQRQAHGLRFDLAVDSVHAIKTTNAHVADAQTRPTVQTVRVTWPAPPSDSVHPGQGWRFALTLRLPHSPINPAGLDGELLRWQQGLDAYALVHKSTPQAATLLADSAWLAPIARLRQYWRTRIEATLENHARSTQWVAALTLGDQAAIDSQDWQLFQRSGIAHLMSISGLHITLFAWLTIQALVRLGRIWAVQHAASFHALPFTMTQIATWLGVALATAYALLSGWGLPAQRTICMLVCFVGVRSLSLYWPWWQAAAFALALICAFDPWALLQPGFWLSFVAVSLLFISNPRQRPGPVAATAPEPSAATGLAQRAIHATLGLVREQAIMTLTLAPLTLFFFQQFAVVGLIANLFAIPWVTLVVTPLCLLGLIWPPLWHLAASATDVLYHVASTLAQPTVAVWELPAIPWPIATLALVGSAWAISPAALPGVLRCWALAWWLSLVLWRPLPPASGEWRLIVLDVGQGSSVLVQTQHHSLIYDSGPAWPGGDAGERIVLPNLRALGLSPHMLIISHNDSDHSGGTDSVLQRYAQLAVLGSELPSTAPPSKTTPFRPCHSGQSWTWDGVLFRVIHPKADTPYSSGNARSCVLHVQSQQGQSFLLTGDIAQAQEAEILQRYPTLRSDIVLLPHHGSQYSSSWSFLSHLKAQGLALAFAQAGAHNRYGHPHAQTLARLTALGIPYRSSPDCGAWIWDSSSAKSDLAQASWRGCTRQRKQRYWHQEFVDSP